ncbi:forkhead associated domain (FHA) containing [Cryptosporidium xiaoi]|uniref:Forkhead associated domain (FHA) containing n=1 Tax=Cryptosporidium xiaoi TaxID=659607 RepID=A0AAV9Y0E5_9CRYT
MDVEESGLSEVEYYSDSIEFSDVTDNECENNLELLNIRRDELKNIDEYEHDDISISNKRMRIPDSSQESCTQNSSFINLSNEIEIISNRIESINKNIKSMINNISPYVCILEQVSPILQKTNEKSIVNIGINGIKIGRSLDSKLPKDRNKNGFMMLSREHAYIYIKLSDGKPESYIVDCNSKNGTFVNNVKIRDYKLQPNDIISFGCKNNSNVYKYKVIKA